MSGRWAPSREVEKDRDAAGMRTALYSATSPQGDGSASLASRRWVLLPVRRTLQGEQVGFAATGAPGSCSTVPNGGGNCRIPQFIIGPSRGRA
jgi:hypothetical protein